MMENKTVAGRNKTLQKWRHREVRVLRLLGSDSTESSDVIENRVDYSSNEHSSSLEEPLVDSFQNSDTSENISDFNSTSSDSDDSTLIEEIEINDVKSELAQWVTQHGVTNKVTNQLLLILRESGFNLPKDCRTLKQTPTSVAVEEKCNGQYVYFGLANGLTKQLSHANVPFQSDTLKLFINIDGVPVYKSSNLQMWPILCAVEHSPPFVVALFCGTKKPNDVEVYLHDFLREVEILVHDGFLYDDKNYHILLSAFVCDAPARSFLKCIKGHGGYYACERCEIRGGYVSCVVLHNSDQPHTLRTDDQFADQAYRDHQQGRTPLLDVGFPCVTGFPLDYMHLVCLGVMKRMIYFWRGGPNNRSKSTISNGNLREISTNLLKCNGKMPSEFARQPRCIFEYERWKPTEFRQFLLYTGPVVLKDVLSSQMYNHFLTLSVAMSIMLNGDSEKRNTYLGYAKQLMTYFVNKSVSLYGINFPVYNVHNLIHLSDDVQHFNCSLNDISAFKFENFLRTLKKMIRAQKYPLAQICKRISECENVGLNTFERDTKNMRISCKMGKDNCFLVANHVAFVKQIDKDGSVVAKTLHTRFTKNFFTDPCDSQLINVLYVTKMNLRRFSDVKVLPKQELQQKLVCLLYKDGWVLMPLLHGIF